MRQFAQPDEATAIDVLIVGGGAAGLLAAHELLRLRPGAHVLVVDAGATLDDRQRDASAQMGGYGGAGLYLGGRLYLGSASIPAQPTVSMPSEWRTVLDREAYLARAGEVDALFSQLGVDAPQRNAPVGQLAEAVALATRAGLEYVTSYPARFLDAEERAVLLRRLLDMLRSRGAHFAFGAQVSGAERSGDGFTVTLTRTSGNDAGQAERLRTRALVLASGRYGAEWLAQTAGKLGASVIPLPAAFGVRLEVPLAVYAPLTDVNPDPRLQLALANDAIVKTYATCLGGIVLPVTRYGFRVVSGVPLPAGARRPSTTFAVLAQPGMAGAAGVWHDGGTVLERMRARYQDTTVVQRLGDIRRQQPTSADALAANPVQPTCVQAQPGAFYDLYPAVYWQAFEELLSRLERLAPGVGADDAVVHAPSEEHFWYFPTNQHLQTNVPGLFVAGDGAGQTQGAVQAGVAGLLAGAGVADYLAG